MARCIRCGDSAWSNNRVCPKCMKKWVARQHAAYDAAESELGPHTAENHEVFVAKVKAVKRKAETLSDANTDDAARAAGKADPQYQKGG
jgi:hypothetical protein